LSYHSPFARWAVTAGDFFTAVKLLGLLVIILTGLGWICAGRTVTLKINMQKESSFDPAGLVLAFYSAYFAYCGMSMAVNMVEELQEPLKRNILVSILLATAPSSSRTSWPTSLTSRCWTPRRW
jgi:amino acid transporter